MASSPASPVSTQSGTAFNGLAADSRSLDQLRSAANQDPAKAIKQVATQFEALFMQMVLKSMREATPKSGMLDSNEQQTYTSMLDEQLAQKIAAGGTGLADVIARQLSRNLPTSAGAAPAAAGTPAATPAAARTTALAGAAVAGTAVAPALPAPQALAGAGATTAAATTGTPVTTGTAGTAAPPSILNHLRVAAAVRGTR